MEDIHQILHEEFINSDDYYVFLRKLDEENEENFKKNDKNTCQIEKNN